jgi:hypothetical protein
MALCSLVCGYQHSRRICWLHLQDRNELSWGTSSDWPLLSSGPLFPPPLLYIQPLLSPPCKYVGHGIGTDPVFSITLTLVAVLWGSILLKVTCVWSKYLWESFLEWGYSKQWDASRRWSSKVSWVGCDILKIVTNSATKTCSCFVSTSLSIMICYNNIPDDNYYLYTECEVLYYIH